MKASVADLGALSKNEVAGRADVVIALALVHHLALAQGMSFQEVVRQLASLTSRDLVVEFMPNGLGGTPQNPRPVPDPLPDWYQLDAFLAALRKSFTTVEVVDYERPDADSIRTLVLCRGVVQAQTLHGVDS
jgi:hypothetical protein